VPLSDWRRTVRRDLADIRDFYLDEEQRARLEKMSRFSRGLHQAGWLLKSLFLKLTPLRRILFVVAFYFLLVPGLSFTLGGIEVNLRLIQLSGLLLVFILMLELKDKLLARNELAEGRAIQQRLLPDPSPAIPGWDAWLFSRPANDVGGDLIDCIRFGPDHHVLVLGDVSGKGLPAALLMVKLQATIRALCTETTPLADLGFQINRIFRRDGITRSFATLVVADVRGEDGRVRLLNAGHTPPAVVRAGSAQPTSKGDPALGLLADTGYAVAEVLLDEGEALLVYSDGINEARNAQGECFGNERLLERVAARPQAGAEAMGRSILGAVQDFLGEARPDDDQTILILRRRAGQK
jgi:serine phosphatase RsbU (regulator of sigma subunit)